MYLVFNSYDICFFVLCVLELCNFNIDDKEWICCFVLYNLFLKKKILIDLKIDCLVWYFFLSFF